MLPITNNIAAHFVERKWMRAAKAWRCVIEIPNTGNVPEVLTALLERQVRAEIAGADISVTIDPAYIVDVPSRKKQFQVVLETCYEHQANLGPRLTAMTDTPVTLSILPLDKTPQQPEQPQSLTHKMLDERTLKGLHISFFQNPKFWEWLTTQTKNTIGNPQQCKAVFKAWLQVESCKDIREDYFKIVVRNFNAWLGGKSEP